MNKTNFPNVIYKQLNGGGDLLLSNFKWKRFKSYKLPLAKSPIWNYDMMFKSKEIIAKERLRFEKLGSRILVKMEF